MREEVQQDHERKLEQLRDEHRRELKTIREKYLDEVRGRGRSRAPAKRIVEGLERRKVPHSVCTLGASQETAERERLSSALQEERERLQASHAVQLERLRSQLDAEFQKLQLMHSRKVGVVNSRN